MRNRGRVVRAAAAVIAALLMLVQPAEAAEKSSVERATVACAGDLMCLGTQIYNARTKNGIDFDYVFSGVKKLLGSADITVGNLETPVAGKKAGYAKRGQPKPPVLNAPYSFLTAVKNAGFDMVATSNNHALDKGENGLLATVKNIRKAGLIETGCFTSKQARRYAIKTVNGIRIGLLSYNDIGYNEKNSAISASKQEWMLNTYGVEKAKRDIAALRKKGRADVIIVYMHWGVENVNTVSAEQESAAKQLADAGADVIIGAHPHALQRAGYIKSVSGKQVIVAYSLGNFTSSMPRVINHDSVILRLYIKKHVGTISIKADYVPVRTGSRYKLLPPSAINTADKARIRSAMGEVFAMALK